jgi:hypothetical protein
MRGGYGAIELGRSRGIKGAYWAPASTCSTCGAAR